MSKDRKIDTVILGLLSHEDLTGYDIKKRIDGAISFFWKGSFGSIYPALAAMETDGLIVKKTAEKTGGREKITYSITETGRQALRNWLGDGRAANDLKYETLLKLFFGGAADLSVSIDNIKRFEADIKDGLRVLRMYREALSAPPRDRDHTYYLLTVDFGIETYEAYLRWCAGAVKTLEDSMTDD